MIRRPTWLLLALTACVPFGGTSPPASSGALQHLDDLPALEHLLKPGATPHWIHFWAMWCAACTQELPRQIEIARKLGPTGMQMTFVNLDGYDKAQEVEGHLASLGANTVARHAQLNMALDVEQITHLFSPNWGGALPATFLRHEDGSPAAEVMGALEPGEEQKLLDTLSMQKPVEDVRPAAP